MDDTLFQLKPRPLRARPRCCPAPPAVHGQAAGETLQESREGLQGRAGQSQKGPAAEERGVRAGVRRERHPQEERGPQLAAHGLARGRRGLQGADGRHHEGGDQKHGAGDQGSGQGAELHGPAEGVGGDGEVRAAGAEPGRAHGGHGGLHELGHHAEHAAGAGGQPDRADRRGERPGDHGPAEPAARGRRGRGGELGALPGGAALPEAGCPAQLSSPREGPRGAGSPSRSPGPASDSAGGDRPSLSDPGGNSRPPRARERPAGLGGAPWGRCWWCPAPPLWEHVGGVPALGRMLPAPPLVPAQS